MLKEKIGFRFNPLCWISACAAEVLSLFLKNHLHYRANMKQISISPFGLRDATTLFIDELQFPPMKAYIQLIEKRNVYMEMNEIRIYWQWLLPFD